MFLLVSDKKLFMVQPASHKEKSVSTSSLSFNQVEVILDSHFMIMSKPSLMTEYFVLVIKRDSVGPYLYIIEYIIVEVLNS